MAAIVLYIDSPGSGVAGCFDLKKRCGRHYRARGFFAGAYAGRHNRDIDCLWRAQNGCRRQRAIDLPAQRVRATQAATYLGMASVAVGFAGDVLALNEGFQARWPNWASTHQRPFVMICDIC